MKKLIALAMVMAGLGAGAAMVALRLLGRPRVAPAPYGPGTPLPTPGNLPPDEDLFGGAALPVAPEPAREASDLPTAPQLPEERPSEAWPPVGMGVVPGETVTEDDEPVGPGGRVAAPGYVPVEQDEREALAMSLGPDVTDDVPSHHLPPAVSDVAGEPGLLEADTADLDPAHAPPAPVSEVTGEHTEAVFEAEETLASPVIEAVDQVSRAEEITAPSDGDFLTTYFNQLAETPVAESAEEEFELDGPAAGVPASAAPPPSAPRAMEAPRPLPARDLAPGRRDAESYLDEGNVYFNVGQYGLAIERYGKAIELDSELTAAHYNRANARTRAGEYDGALIDYDTALRLHPHDADALNNRGMLHLYRASYDEALRDFDEALSIDPADTTVMVNRGLAHLHGGDAAAALVDFQSATALDQGDAAAHYGAAQAAASLENRAESLRHLSRAFEIDPGYAREAAADPKLQPLQGDDEFMRLLRESGSRAER